MSEYILLFFIKIEIIFLIKKNNYYLLILMLYFNLLPDELMDLIFFKLKSDSILLKDISDRYPIFLDNLNKGNYLPENVFKILNSGIKDKMLKYINDIKDSKFDIHYNGKDIKNYDYTDVERVEYRELSKDIYDIMINYINNSKYIFLYHETWYREDEGDSQIYLIQTKIDEFVIIDLYLSCWYSYKPLNIHINKNFKYLWETILNKEEYNPLLSANSYIESNIENHYNIKEL
jgi:hypothetical protein